MKTRGFIPVVLCLTVVAVVGMLWVNDRIAIRELRIALGPRIGYGYSWGDAYAQIISVIYPRLRLVPVETRGMQENLEEIKAGRVQLAIAPLDRAVGGDVRIMALLYPQPFHLVVRAESGIKGVKDLKGKCVVVPPRETESYRDFLVLMRHYGLTGGDVTLREIKLLRWKAAMVKELAGVRVDAVFAVPDRDLDTVAVQMALLVRSDVDARVVNDMTRLLFEYQNELIARTPLAVSLSSPDKVRVIGAPAVHRGALAYYNREKPDIIKRYYNEICVFFTLGPMLLSVFLAVHARIQARRLKRIDEYIRQISELFMQIEAAKDLQGLIDLERALLKLFARSLKDLDGGRISAGDIQSLSMIWDKAVDAVHHRQLAWVKKG
ncbi:MAG: ABC transporter substrate-binding protein [Candidatus Aureabacteria bacterium]|nr:ABC transporter substrate-binding protein [Candidatus Auribacterota bacterium]